MDPPFLAYIICEHPLMLGWSWTDLSQLFGQASAESCDELPHDSRKILENPLIYMMTPTFMQFFEHKESP